MKYEVKINHLFLSPAPPSFFQLCYAADGARRSRIGKRAPTWSQTPIYLLMNSVSLYYKYFLMTPVRHRMLGYSDLSPNTIYIGSLGDLYLVIILKFYKAYVDSRLLLLWFYYACVMITLARYYPETERKKWLLLQKIVLSSCQLALFLFCNLKKSWREKTFFVL